MGKQGNFSYGLKWLNKGISEQKYMSDFKWNEITTEVPQRSLLRPVLFKKAINAQRKGLDAHGKKKSCSIAK